MFDEKKCPVPRPPPPSSPSTHTYLPVRPPFHHPLSASPRQQNLLSFSLALRTFFPPFPHPTLPPCLVPYPRQKGGKPTTQHAQWYGADYTAVEVEEDTSADVAELIEGWDGCTYVDALGESPNVPGIGEVSQVRGTVSAQRHHLVGCVCRGSVSWCSFDVT